MTFKITKVFFFFCSIELESKGAWCGGAGGLLTRGYSSLASKTTEGFLKRNGKSDLQKVQLMCMEGRLHPQAV